MVFAVDLVDAVWAAVVDYLSWRKLIIFADDSVGEIRGYTLRVLEAGRADVQPGNWGLASQHFLAVERRIPGINLQVTVHDALDIERSSG